MKIGHLRHRVTIQKKHITTDVLKQQKETWADIATVWASVEPLSGREYFAARQTNTDVTVKVIMRYRPGVSTDMRIIFNDRVFEIISVINHHERCRILVLMCREVLK